MITLPDCSRPSRIGHRCGDCSACRDTRVTLWRLFDKGNGPMVVAEMTGLARTKVQAYSNRWAAERGRDVRPHWNGKHYDGDDAGVKRPVCRCGLSITKEHTPETCDLGLHSTGMGQWVGLTW